MAHNAHRPGAGASRAAAESLICHDLDGRTDTIPQDHLQSRAQGVGPLGCPMKAVDLRAELAMARQTMTDDQRALLAAAGVPMPIWRQIGVAPILLDRAGTIYQPTLPRCGPLAFIMPVRVGAPDWSYPDFPDPARAVEAGAIIDLVAFHPDDEMAWATRRDLAAWLGAIEPQYCDPDPVSIRRSPLSWLKAGRTGLCILTRKPQERRDLLLDCHSITAEDEQHARELRHLAQLPYPAPRISVPSPSRAA